MNRSKTTQTPEPSPPVRPALLTLDELAAHLRVHVSSIVRLIDEGLPFLDVGAGQKNARRRFNVTAVEGWLAARGGAR